MNSHTHQSAERASLIHPAPEYVGRHRAPAQLDRRPVVMQAGVGISLATYPHLTLTDATGAVVEIPLSPEHVEHIEAAASVRRAVLEAKRQEQESREIEAARSDWYATNQEHAEHDPTDAELAQSWNAPDAPAAHRAAWALHQGLHDRSAS